MDDRSKVCVDLAQSLRSERSGSTDNPIRLSKLNLKALQNITSDGIFPIFAETEAVGDHSLDPAQGGPETT